MKFIFPLLALGSLAVAGYTFWLGWRFHDGTVELARREAEGQPPAADERAAIGALIGPHFVWGMASGVAVAFVHSVVLVYFLGTGKAIKEQMELRHWDGVLHGRSKRLMAQSILPASAGIVLIVLGAFSGGFAMIQFLPPEVHLAIAALALAGQAVAYVVEFALIVENGRLMDAVIERLGGDDVRLVL